MRPEYDFPDAARNKHTERFHLYGATLPDGTTIFPELRLSRTLLRLVIITADSVLDSLEWQRILECENKIWNG
jgi:hypothetical protein